MVERRLRLRREAEVREVRARGRAWADGPLVARLLPNRSEPAQNRYTVVAGKKAGKAVERNRMKRLVREAIRHLHPRLVPGHDVVIIVRGTVEELPGLTVAQASLERIMARAGVLRRADAAPPSARQLDAPGHGSGSRSAEEAPR